MEDDQINEVEKILKKRGNGQEAEYLLKWKGFASSHNSWEPLENLSCEELLQEFEHNRAQKIFGVKKGQNGDIIYIAKFKDVDDLQSVLSAEAKMKWSHLVIEFLEAHLFWYRQIRFADGAEENPFESNNVDGLPIAIRYVTNVTGKFTYWCEWEGERFKFVTAAEAKVLFPRLVADFLEDNLIIEE